MPITELKVQKKVDVVCAALIDKNNSILIAKRPDGKEMSGLWEFPGGKIETGETQKQALERELKEELSIQCQELTFISSIDHHYPDFMISLSLYACTCWSGLISTNHYQQMAWIKEHEFDHYKMPEADKPLVEGLQKYLSKTN